MARRKPMKTTRRIALGTALAAAAYMGVEGHISAKRQEVESITKRIVNRELQKEIKEPRYITIDSVLHLRGVQEDRKKLKRIIKDSKTYSALQIRKDLVDFRNEIRLIDQIIVKIKAKPQTKETKIAIRELREVKNFFKTLIKEFEKTLEGNKNIPGTIHKDPAGNILARKQPRESTPQQKGNFRRPQNRRSV